MKASFFALTLTVAGLAGCASDYAPPAPTNTPGPVYEREMHEGRPGLFGDLRWNIQPGSSTSAVRTSDEEEYKRWKESNPSSAERREFEEWRAWQEWKRKNPK